MAQAAHDGNRIDPEGTGRHSVLAGRRMTYLMNVKTESKLLLSALLLLPLGAGIVMIISDAWGIYPYLISGIGLVGLIWLWLPRKWFQREDKSKHH